MKRILVVGFFLVLILLVAIFFVWKELNRVDIVSLYYKGIPVKIGYTSPEESIFGSPVLTGKVIDVSGQDNTEKITIKLQTSEETWEIIFDPLSTSTTTLTTQNQEETVWQALPYADLLSTFNRYPYISIRFNQIEGAASLNFELIQQDINTLSKTVLFHAYTSK